jgi:hypothetical protein
MDDNHTHIPFKSLPAESKFLFFMLAAWTMALYRDWPPTPAEIWGDLEAAWDTEALTEDEFQLPNRIEKVLEKYLAKYASDEGRWWLEHLHRPIRRCQRRNRA